MGIIYRVRVTGGQLRNETGGSTDLADWIPVTQVPSLERTVTIDAALELARDKPSGGHVEPVPLGGLLRL